MWLIAAGLAALPTSAFAANPGTVDKLLTDYAIATGLDIADLPDDELAQLSKGKTIYRKLLNKQNPASTQLRIIGYRVISKPRENLWLAALAYDAGYSRRLTEHLVALHDRGGASWYQHVDMPWPLRNRHWLIRTRKNVDMANESEDRIWEHSWQLVDNADQAIDRLLATTAIDGLDSDKARNAIRLPLNNGAWVMAHMDNDTTLVIMHATMDMGGVIPDGIVARYTRRQLAAALKKIERDADTARSRYDSNYVIYRGNGSPIDPDDQLTYE